MKKIARLNPSVLRALNLLEALAVAPNPLTLREIVLELALPRTTVYELLTTLVERGYVTKSGDETARYGLGIRAFQLGNAFVDKLDYIEIGRESAAALTALSGETSHVAVLDESDVVYIARAESPQKVRMISSLGSRIPAHCTAVGKALISQLSPQEFARRFPDSEPLARLTPNTITDPAELATQMATVRERGYAIENCESNPDVCCAAAPVRDHDGQVIAAISVSVPKTRWVAHPEDYWVGMVRESAAVYAERLGHSNT